MKQIAAMRRRHNVRYLEIIMLAFFAIGIVTANLYGKSRLNQYGLMNHYFIQQIKYVSVNKADFFVYILSVRIPVLLFLLVLGMTSLYKFIHGAFLAWTGFSFGFICVSAISNLGMGAVLLVLGFLFPQILFYALCYLLLVFMQWNYHEHDRKKKRMEWMILFGILLMLFSIGVITEAYVNPLFYPFLLKNF